MLFPSLYAVYCDANYFNGVENIINGKKQYLLVGNFLFATSYLGYFAIHVLGNIDYFFITGQY